MKNNWTELNEVRRTYLQPDGGSIVIDEPRGLFISESRTHYLSNEDDTKRCIVPWPFSAITIEVEDSQDWSWPPPRLDIFDEPVKTNSGPWSVSDIFQNGK